jgi:hypothetical protein
MKTRFAVLLASAAGFLAGLVGSNILPLAHAANTIIYTQSDQAVLTQCNFDKTIVALGRGVACVAK